MITYILILLSILTLDVTFNYFFVISIQPQSDLWKLIVFGIVIGVSVWAAIKYALSQKAKWWKAIYILLPTAFAYALLKNMSLGLLWHCNPFYLSENHFPDNLILKYFNNGYLYSFFLVVCAGFFSGLTRYICSTFKPKENENTL